MAGTGIYPVDLVPLAGLARLQFVTLQADADDDAWGPLAMLPKLRQLSLRGRVSNAAIRELGNVKQLHTIW